MSKDKSFTIIEIILTTSIFTLVVIATFAIFLSTVKSKERVYKIKEIEDNARYVLELMSKEIGTAKRFADDEKPGTDIDLTELDFINYSDENIRYCRSDDEGNCSDTGDYLAKNGVVLTSNKVKITNLSFNVNRFGYSLFQCGDPVTFSYKGSSVTYGTVESQGKCWMDRNLGASQVATAYNDSQAYGDLFQWGRLSDLHQNRTSSLTTPCELSTTDDPGHSNFICSLGSPWDWRDPQNNNLWQGVAGINNPCPVGWRLPTITEWENERLSWAENNYNGAFNSLKLTVGGIRRYDNPSIIRFAGYNGYYWSSSIQSVISYTMSIYGFDAFKDNHYRADGCSVRCIYDSTDYLISHPKITILITIVSAIDPSIKFNFQNTISLRYGQ